MQTGEEEKDGSGFTLLSFLEGILSSKALSGKCVQGKEMSKKLTLFFSFFSCNSSSIILSCFVRLIIIPLSVPKALFVLLMTPHRMEVKIT